MNNAIAVVTSELVNGMVKFHSCEDCKDTIITINLTGPKNSIHAIHIHEYGDTTNGCTSLGDHYNPYKTTHGSFRYPEFPRHAGDLINNIEFDNDGYFFIQYADPSVNILDIYGRSIVIHHGVDDEGKGVGRLRDESLKTGNAGARIACGVIGRMK